MVDVCDVPVISPVCDVAGDAAGALVSAPFDWLAQGMGHAAGWMFEAVWKVFDSTTMVDVTSSQYTKVYNILFGVAVFVMLGFFMLQVIGGMIRREPSALSRAALGLAKSILGSFVALALLATALEITDQLCIGIVNAAGTNMEEMGDRIALLTTGLVGLNLAAPGAGAILTIFIAGLAIGAAGIVWISLLVRKALLLIAIVFAPDCPRRVELGPHARLGEQVGIVRDRADPLEGRPGGDLPARHRTGLRPHRQRHPVGVRANRRCRTDADGRVRAVHDLQGDQLHGLRHVPRDVGRARGQGCAQPANADPDEPCSEFAAEQGARRRLERRRLRWFPDTACSHDRSGTVDWRRSCVFWRWRRCRWWCGCGKCRRGRCRWRGCRGEGSRNGWGAHG